VALPRSPSSGLDGLCSVFQYSRIPRVNSLFVIPRGTYVPCPSHGRLGYSRTHSSPARAAPAAGHRKLVTRRARVDIVSLFALMAGCPPEHQTSQKDQINSCKGSCAYTESEGMLGASDTPSSSSLLCTYHLSYSLVQLCPLSCRCYPKNYSLFVMTSTYSMCRCASAICPCCVDRIRFNLAFRMFSGITGGGASVISRDKRAARSILSPTQQHCYPNERNT